MLINSSIFDNRILKSLLFELSIDANSSFCVLAKLSPSTIKSLTNGFNGFFVLKDIGLAQPTISQHLNELKQVGIIKGTIEGTSVCYCIHDENWEEIKNILGKFLNKNTTGSCC